MEREGKAQAEKEAEAEAEAMKFLWKQSGSGSGSGAKNLEAEAEAFLKNKTKMEAEAEANFFWKKFWKRKRIFFEKSFGSGSGSEFFWKKNRKRKRKRSQNQLLPKHCSALQLVPDSYSIILICSAEYSTSIILVHIGWKTYQMDAYWAICSSVCSFACTAHSLALDLMRKRFLFMRRFHTISAQSALSDKGS